MLTCRLRANTCWWYARRRRRHDLCWTRRHCVLVLNNWTICLMGNVIIWCLWLMWAVTSSSGCLNCCVLVNGSTSGMCMRVLPPPGPGSGVRPCRDIVGVVKSARQRDGWKRMRWYCFSYDCVRLIKTISIE